MHVFNKQALLAACLLLPAAAFAQTLSFHGALQMATEQASSLTARAAAVDGAAALQTGAKELPAPRLTLGVDNLPINGPDRLSLTRDFMTMRQIGWMQDVPSQRIRAARSEVALSRTAREQALLQAERVAVRRDAALAWLGRYFAERRLSVFAELEHENKLLQDTATSRVATGRALATDALTVRQDSLALADRRDELQRELARQVAALRRWVGDAAGLPLSGAPPGWATDATQLQNQVDQHADLAAYGPMSAVAQAEAREAEAAKSGDWGWGLAYSKRGPAYSDMLSVQFTFELPLGAARRHDPQVAAKRKEAEQIEAQREDLRRRRTEELTALLADEQEVSAKRSRLEQKGLPLAQERLTLLMASYRAGRAELADVLAARRELAEQRLRGVDLEAQQATVRLRMNSFSQESSP
jgi:outer membrane protein, heavy metal efflux system